MLVKNQKFASSLQSNLTYRAFSPRETYHEGSIKSAPHLRETATEVSGKAGQWQSYKGASSLSTCSTRCYSYGVQWFFLGVFLAQTRGVMFARAGDNEVFLREPCNLFDPSYVKVVLPGQLCIHCLGYLEARVASIINPLGTPPENEVKCSVFFAYYAIIM